MKQGVTIEQSKAAWSSGWSENTDGNTAGMRSVMYSMRQN